MSVKLLKRAPHLPYQAPVVGSVLCQAALAVSLNRALVGKVSKRCSHTSMRTLPAASRETCRTHGFTDTAKPSALCVAFVLLRQEVCTLIADQRHDKLRLTHSQQMPRQVQVRPTTLDCLSSRKW